MGLVLSLGSPSAADPRASLDRSEDTPRLRIHLALVAPEAFPPREGATPVAPPVGPVRASWTFGAESALGLPGPDGGPMVAADPLTPGDGSATLGLPGPDGWPVAGAGAAFPGEGGVALGLPGPDGALPGGGPEVESLVAGSEGARAASGEATSASARPSGPARTTVAAPYPIVVNAPVEAAMEYFTARERDRFGMWMERSGRYLGMIQKVLRERGLPAELAYTAMIESGFSHRAVSRAGAKGLWQFMEATARRYGLVVDRWVDERLDPVKSTEAAARYLSDLHDMFGHWFLAQAAYNAGEARVAHAIRRARTNDFWALTRTRYLPNETKRFVPQILAATVISLEPVRFGFAVAAAPPLAYDEVSVRRTVDLESVAALAGVSVDELRDLNPALRAGITPPFGRYRLRVPPGSRERVAAALEGATEAELPVWGLHRIQPHQGLGEIARMYQMSPDRLAEVNRLPNGRLRGVRELVVPVSNRVVIKSRPAEAGHAGGPAGETVVVRPGDSLWQIARRHGIDVRTLAALNGRDVKAPLFPGERLRVSR